MKLLDLAGGAASLELRPTEVAEVLDHLRHFGSMTREKQATHEVVRVGGHAFVYTDEWDAPCLISSDAAGTAILAEIAHGPAPRHAVAG